MKETDQLSKLDIIQKEVLGNILSELREKNGWTVTELCQIAGIDRDSYLKIERGERNPTLGIIVSVSHALNITLSNLFNDKYIERCKVKENDLEIDKVITDNFCRIVNRKKVITTLKKLRKQNEMSQTLVAIQMNIPRSIINNFEYGRDKVTPTLLKSMINVFDLSLEEFCQMVNMKY